MSLKRSLSLNLKNISGWRTSRKLFIIESDDWGSNRMPSQKHHNGLVKAGIKLDGKMDSVDTIERREDLEGLYDVLRSVKDKNGNPAVITPFMNVANPHFEKIKAAGFREYFLEPFTDTLARYGEEKEVTALYRQGVAEGIFKPEFHSREHLSVLPWMRYLQAGDNTTRTAFDYDFYSVMPKGMNPTVKGFRSAFYFETRDEMSYLDETIRQGTEMFQHFFGYKPTVFDAPNGVFHPDLEPALADVGIVSLGTKRDRKEPDGRGGLELGKYSFGQRNKLGQKYYIRNCQFEPWSTSKADYCLPMVAAAFRWGKPAILSSHRASFAGGIDEKNRATGLSELKKLLTAVIRRWPDVEFVSSASLAALMHQK